MSGGADAQSPEQAEAVFYAAFESGDLEAMAAIWLRTDDIVCVHPHGPRLVGYTPVMQSWRNILENTDGFRLSVELVNQHGDGDMTIRFVNETLVNENNKAAPVTVLATNAYRRTEAGWRIILHHASPAPRSEGGAGDENPDPPDTAVTLH